jgi:hypothetical protein
MRKKVAVFLLSKLELDEYACKFIILRLNLMQDYFEFEFPDNMRLAVDRTRYIKHQDMCARDYLFDGFAKMIEETQQKSPYDADYYIGITSVTIDTEDYFWTVEGNKAIITTKGWEKNYAPPSVFEYILQSVAGTLVKMASAQVKDSSITEHPPARGCILDDAYDKKDNKIDTSLGYICDECKTKIETALGDAFLCAIEKICSRDCLGDIETKNSAAYDLKKFFRVNVDKDTGFNKTFWEKAKEHISKSTEEIIIGTVIAIASAIITYLLVR